MTAPGKLGDLYAEARHRLRKGAVEDGALEARILIEHLAGHSRDEIILRPEKDVEERSALSVLAAVDRRLSGEPVHRILGFREFYGLRLKLSPDTLEPRPDTEILVDAVLPHAREVVRRQGECRIVDLGTGTGAIALAILAQVPETVALGVDVNPLALETARDNAEFNAVSERFRVLESDWFSAVDGAFDVIVSNPPYIASKEVLTLAREVRDFDPALALDGGMDGLECYRIIAQTSKAHLKVGGLLALEIGHDQRATVTDLFEKSGFTLAAIHTDLGRRDRVLVFEIR